MNRNKNVLISFIITLMISSIVYYLLLPPVNLSSPLFWIFLGSVIIIYTITSLILGTDLSGRIRFPKINYYIFGGYVLVLSIILIINFVLSPIFNSKKYSNRITIDETGNFIEDIEKVNFHSLPLLDKSSSRKLGDRVMGQMPELVSQFSVSNLYTQINYNNKIMRVTPLEYNGIFKYLSNYKKGVTGYITVDSVTGESSLIKLKKGMKYLDSAILGKDLNRKLRFTYPTLIFGEKAFEIDNEGNPYWIVQVLKYSGVGLKRDVTGIIILDPITGESKKYNLEEIPTWVDHVFDANLVIEQVNNWGTYKNGFLNSIFGQKNVVVTTEGYNYTVMNDDVYLYTGITSVANDESNIGFILSNLRTKETKYYPVAGAEEYSAMSSAEGKVQQMGYTASFPLLINLNNRPTYLISLKDDSGLVKMYGFVDVVDYQKVVVTDAALGIEKAAANYLESIKSINEDSLITKEIVIKTITSAIIDGNTYYYIETNGKKYKVSIKTNKDLLPFLKVNDKIEIGYNDDNEVIEILKITKK